MRGSALAFLLTAVLGFAPVASAAEPIALDADQEWNVQIRPTHQDQRADFRAAFRVDVDRGAYLKVLPTPWNPAFRNGTANQTGWWTELAWLMPRTGPVFAWTNGSAPVELGILQANTTYAMRISVHAPGQALTAPVEYRLAFSLAVRTPGNGSGSGGSLDPSLSVLPVLDVTYEAPAAASAANPDMKPDWHALQPWLIGAVLIVVIVGAFLLGRSRRGKGAV